MAPRSSKAGKGARRQTVRPRRDAGVPLLPVVVGAVLGVLAIVMIGTIVYLNRPAPAPGSTVSGIPCDHLEQTQVHYHVGLQIVYKGVLTNLRDYTGIQLDSSGKIQCYYWLHIHPEDKNVIHIESPASDTFTLGQFFDVWNHWSTVNGYGSVKLDSNHVATFTIGPSDRLIVYVDKGDGKGPTVYTGDPRAIVLKNHEVISLVIAPPDNPPPAFTFPSGL